MRIGLTGGGTTADRMVSQASRAEADGFTSMWYPSSAGGGDPVRPVTGGQPQPDPHSGLRLPCTG